MTAYNIAFTSLPPIAMAIFDRDVNDDYIDKYPELFREVKKSMFWNFWTVLGWMGSALYQCTGTFKINNSHIRVYLYHKQGRLNITDRENIRLLAPNQPFRNTTFNNNPSEIHSRFQNNQLDDIHMRCIIYNIEFHRPDVGRVSWIL